MQFTPMAIPDVIIVEPKVFGDERGFFMETWNARSFAENGLNLTFVQDNHSKSGRGILRGLHYQIKNNQGKLVRVVAGEVFDVAVDLRKSSPTFGKWVGEYLTHHTQSDQGQPYRCFGHRDLLANPNLDNPFDPPHAGRARSHFRSVDYQVKMRTP